MDNDFEVLAFPDLFPYGSGGYHSANRKVKLPIRKYFQQQLLNVDGRFAQNIEYLFLCTIYSRHKTNREWCYISHLLICEEEHLEGTEITAGQLWNPAVVEQLVRNEQAYTFLKNVRGSPAYWQDQLYDVLAMLCMLSIPTWFLTLSAADLHWPEMIQAVAVQFGQILTQKDVLKMSIADRSKYLHQNPITGVWMFQRRLEAFFWIPAQWYTPTRSYHRLCNKNWIPEERITSCPLLAMGKRSSKNRQRSRWRLCFHWPSVTSNTLQQWYLQ